MKFITKLKKQLVNDLEEEGVYFLNGRERGNLKISTISIETRTETLQLAINELRYKLERGEDPSYWLTVLQCDLNDLKKHSKIIKEIVP